MPWIKADDIDDDDWRELVAAETAIAERAKLASEPIDWFRNAEVGRVFYGEGDQASVDELNRLQRELMGHARRVAAKLGASWRGMPELGWVCVLGCLKGVTEGREVRGRRDVRG